MEQALDILKKVVGNIDKDTFIKLAGVVYDLVKAMLPQEG